MRQFSGFVLVCMLHEKGEQIQLHMNELYFRAFLLVWNSHAMQDQRVLSFKLCGFSSINHLHRTERRRSSSAIFNAWLWWTFKVSSGMKHSEMKSWEWIIKTWRLQQHFPSSASMILDLSSNFIPVGSTHWVIRRPCGSQHMIMISHKLIREIFMNWAVCWK